MLCYDAVDSDAVTVTFINSVLNKIFIDAIITNTANIVLWTILELLWI